MTNFQSYNITPELSQKLILEQFPEYGHLPVKSVEKQGHDNRTFRLGDEMLIRMPTDAQYALKVAKVQFTAEILVIWILNPTSANFFI